MPVWCSLACIAVLGLLSGSSGLTSALQNPEKLFTRPVRRDVKAIPQNQLNISALNTALAFEPYQDLTARSAVGQQDNILFSPLGLASALALLCRASDPESRRRALQVLGVEDRTSQKSFEATLSALADLQHNLTIREGGGEGVYQKMQSEAVVEAPMGSNGSGAEAGNDSDVNDGAEGRSQLLVRSNLHVDGKPSVDFEGFLSQLQHPEQPELNTSFETLMTDLRDSDKLNLNSFVYFKGLQPFERRHTVLRSFQLNATTSVEVDMMFLDDSSEVMMLYDTNCSATVVRLAFTERLASLLLLPKGGIQPLEDCLSDHRMRFWLSNLKPGRAEIRFPKFQLRKSYNLESILRKAGISSLSLHAGNVSWTQEMRKLKLNEALHEVMLEVEESGSREMAKMDVPLDFSVPQRITFDRPFILIIYDYLTGLVLLISRITDPTDV
ncbi:serine protease inhibitor A3K-like [Cyprinodon tularosa]|uniref:serine protease inhibitor A3K-like n=1 Tax=Cyprinodon tularosa TaxID=77115 RepID=UPI0018E2128B|nr:serine protease inhibitor A3K-like [Cyprinodon tularosa]